MAVDRGVQIEGLCWYPFLDYPGWDDGRYCPAGVFGYADGEGTRAPYHRLHRAMRSIGAPRGASADPSPIALGNKMIVIGAAELNIHLAKDAEEALFKWLIASFLMGKRIRGDVAAQAYRIIVEKHRRDTPSKLAACTSGQLVRMLGEARYTRYDESTASRLLKLSERLSHDYGGKVLNILEVSKDRSEFESRLKKFEGIGPKTVEIFMRDAQQVLF